MMKHKIIELIGSQSSSDSNFLLKRMRFHQGWWRACVLGEIEGAHPKIKEKTICSSINNGLQNKLNFVDSYALKAIEDTMYERKTFRKGLIDEIRLYNNLLSSQPLCFNFFGRLKYKLELATMLFSKYYSTINKITGIFFEFVPQSSTNEDNSAFDIAIEFIDINDNKGLIGIECKYTEPFSQTEYDKPSYRRIYDESKSFKSAYSDLIKKEYNQLFRNDLIAESALQSKTYTSVFSGLFCYQEDGNALLTGNEYQTMLNNSECRFKVITFQSFIEQLQQLELDWETREWSMILWARYMAKKLSDSFY